MTSNHVTGPHAEIIKGGISPDILKRIEIKVSISHTYLTAVSSALVISWCDE